MDLELVVVDTQGLCVDMGDSELGRRILCLGEMGSLTGTTGGVVEQAGRGAFGVVEVVEGRLGAEGLDDGLGCVHGDCVKALAEASVIALHDEVQQVLQAAQVYLI